MSSPFAITTIITTITVIVTSTDGWGSARMSSHGCTPHPSVLMRISPLHLSMFRRTSARLLAQMPRKVGRKKGPGRKQALSPESSGAWPETSDDASSSGAWPDLPKRRKAKRSDNTSRRRKALRAEESRKSEESTESRAWPKSEVSCSPGAWSESSSSGDPAGQGVQESKKATHVMNAEDVIVRGALKREGQRSRKAQKRVTRATNVGRIRELLQKQRCPGCGKEDACTRVSIAFAHAAAETYWSMSDEERAMVMYCMYSEAAGRDEKTGKCSFKHVSWTMGSTRVCFHLFCKILGTSTTTVRKYVNGTWGPKVVHTKEKSASHFVDFFFMSMYQSAAEPLPHLPAAAQALARPRKDPDPDFDHPDMPSLNAGDPLNPEEREHWSAQAPPVEMYSRLAAVAHSSASDIGLPCRFLPNMPLIHFYWLLVSSWDSVQAMTHFPVSKTSASQKSESRSSAQGESRSSAQSESLTSAHCMESRSSGAWGVPSYDTFRRRYIEVWDKCLIIRKASQHSQCQTCWELQQKINKRGSMQAKLEAVRDLGQHYADQYADRCLYWALRHASRMRDNVLVIIIDSMDKAKFAWPRYPWARLPKNLEGLIRPRLSLTAAIAHGYVTNFFLASERVNHGPDCFLEQLFTTIQDVSDMCRENGWPMPEHLVVQADNTVAQCKNNWANLALAYLVMTRKFKSATMNYLMVGHTHEDIGRVRKCKVCIQHHEAAMIQGHGTLGVQDSRSPQHSGSPGVQELRHATSMISATMR